MIRRYAVPVVLVCVALVAAASVWARTGASSAQQQQPRDGSAFINFVKPGFAVFELARACMDTVRSTESGTTWPMPHDFDGNAQFAGPAGPETWLLSNHELTEPRRGDFQGDVGRCFVPEQGQTNDDGDSDGWGSVTRLLLAKDGVTVLDKEVITTGLHNLCAAAITPWKTYLTGEEFPFLNDPDLRSGWVWEVDPETGATRRLTGMGRFSHEQMAYASNGSWYMTDDRGDDRFIYRFDPYDHRDLTEGELYGLAFDKATMTGFWVGPLNPLAPEADMRARGFQPEVWGFVKAEGIVAQGSSNTLGGNYFVFTESGRNVRGRTPDPGRVWRIDHLGNDGTVRGQVLVEGDFARMSRPDNLRFNDAGDLFIFEDHSDSEFPLAQGKNDVWVLPRQKEGAENLILLATVPGRAEPTGPWFSFDNEILYLSIQDQVEEGAPAPFVQSRLLAIRHPTNWNRPYDRP